MGIEDLKTWQWMALGIVAGLMLGGVRLFIGPSFDDGRSSMDQIAFERELRQVDPDGNPMLHNLVVHPPTTDGGSAYWVTGTAAEVKVDYEKPGDSSSPRVYKEWLRPFLYQAKTPYVALFEAASGAVKPKEGATYPTVIQYLETVQKEYAKSDFTFRHAWWESTPATLGLHAAGGLLVIGIAWPTFLGMLSGVGLARKPRSRAELAQRKAARKAAKKPAPVKKVDTSEQDRKLDEMNAALEAELLGDAKDNRYADEEEDDIPTPPAVKPLTGTAYEPPAAIQEKPKGHSDDEYTGDYYPVVRGGAPKETPEKAKA